MVCLVFLSLCADHIKIVSRVETDKPAFVSSRKSLFPHPSSPTCSHLSSRSNRLKEPAERRVCTHPALLQTVEGPRRVVQTQKLSDCQAVKDKQHQGLC